MKALETLAEIELAIRRLIETGLSVQQNWPSMKGLPHGCREIGISGAPELSISMKDKPYWEIYEGLSDAGAYHSRLIDGTLVQMLYRFQGDKLIGHRLCTFPAPALDPYETEPQPYEDDEIFADIVAKNIVHVPLRFDFDDAVHIDVDHPKSHLTLGQYLNCRIPVNAPLTPARFLRFLLRNFYFNAFKAHALEKIGGSKAFAETITAKERSVAYLSC